MYEPKDNKEEQNFWVSYADLMAGLLFVFILLIGAIVIKYVYVQSDLDVIKTSLKNKDIDLQDKISKINDIKSKLESTKAKSLHLSFELAKLNNTYNMTKNELEKSKQLSKKLTNKLQDKNKMLALSSSQIEKITKILEDKNNQIKLLDTSIQNQKDILNQKDEKLKFTYEEIDKLKDLLLGYELKQKEYISINEDLLEKNNKLINNNQNIKNKLIKQENAIALKDEELELLTVKLLTQLKEHQKLVEEFDITKVKIKSLTGIRIKVIKALKDKLGNTINIDSKSGAIKFSSNILFDQGSYILKNGSKKELSKILKKYINALLFDKNIRKYIDNIVIQGHTNSDGSYLYNLELSQKRALEVMKFLYSLNIKNKVLLEKYISASGRSYSDRIKDKNGFEEKDASRRIEIKFRIKNEQAIKQLSNYLDK